MTLEDEFGFPAPASFEDETPKRHRPSRRSGWRFLAICVSCAAIVAAMVQFSSDVADGRPGLMESLKESLQDLMGGSPRATFHRLQTKLTRGDLEGALAEADRLVEMVPQEGHFYRAHVLSELGRRRESIDSYTKAIELGCWDQATAYNNRAYMRALEQIDLKQALADVEKALGVAGDNPAFVDTRGYLYYLMGEPELALNDFDSILTDADRKGRSELAAGWGEIYFHRGLVHRFLGNEEKASEDFLAAVQLGFTIEEYPEPVREFLVQQDR